MTSVSMSYKICFQWPTLLPYHVARIRAVIAAVAGRPVEVAVCETASQDITGQTNFQPDAAFERYTVCRGKSIAELKPAEVTRDVQSILSRMQPDVVAINSYSFADARACLAWCIDTDRRAILMTDSRKQDAPRPPWREHLKSKIIQCYDAAIVAGSPHRQYLTDLGFPSDRIFEGYDVVDNAFFATGADAARNNAFEAHSLPGLTDQTPFFLSVGRMISRKGYPTLLSAYKRYRELTDKPWRLVIVGDGTLRSELMKETATRQIDGVTFAGSQPYSAMPTYYGRAEAFIHAASVDQWGLVVNEAMAAGLPVIVSDGAGCSADLVVDGSSGFVFPTGNSERLGSLMLKLSTDPSLRESMGRESRNRIKEWGPDRFAKSVIDAAEYALRNPIGRPWAGKWILSSLRIAGRSPTAFHTVES
ncbi:MAG TPA: glycosyltransferase family 4 protein [Rhodothermales bacterium]|nr:glycosyltransferase family 4 protein [Rhodothermales bacterium]